MDEPPFSPKKMFRVLHAIRDETDRRRNIRKVFQLRFDDMSSLETSFYCRLLEEQGYITARSLDDPTGTYTYPKAITPAGKQLLDSTDVSFWEGAEKLVVGLLSATTKVNLEPFVAFFHAAYDTYQRNKET